LGKPNQSVYRLYAPLYDAIFGSFFAPGRQRAVEVLALLPGERVYIPGIGTGLDLPLLPDGAAGIGGDISSEMLKKACARERHPEIELVEMDVQHPDLPDASFDAALLNLIVSVAPDGRAVVSQAWRLLKNDGRMIIFDKFAPEGKHLGLARRLFGVFSRILGTDINRRLGDLISGLPGMVVTLNEPSIHSGLYRVVKLIKKSSM